MILVKIVAVTIVVTSSSLAPDFALLTVHSLLPLLRRGTVCHPTFDLHQHCLLLKSARDSFVSTVVICTLRFNLIRAAYVVQHPCCDFVDMLQRPISCRFIIIIIITLAMCCECLVALDDGISYVQIYW